MTTAAQLIREALTLAHISNPRDEIEGYLISQGLTCLNDCIAQWGHQGIYIPYFNQLTINLIPNQYIYPSTKVIVQILEANTTQNDNVKSLVRVADDFLFNEFDYTIGNGRPWAVYLSKEQFFPDPQNTSLGSQLYVYPSPDSQYQLNLLLKFELNQETLFDQMLQFPPYYLKPLKYQLALDLSNIANSSLPATFINEYNRLMNDLKATTPFDLSVKVDDPFYEYRNYNNRFYYVV